jgi:hypothetical protein
MSLGTYECDQCRETNTISDILGTVLKVGGIVVLGYVLFNFRSELKDAVGKAVQQAKRVKVSVDGLEGHKKSRKRKK